MIKGHGKHQVDAGLEEAVGARKVSDFAFAATQQRADSTSGSLRTPTLVHADTQVHRVTL